jgi:hypothetical protein
MDGDMSMSMVFSKPLQQGFTEYFDGWERYGIKEDNGEMHEVSPNEIDTLRLNMKPDDELYVGPSEDVREYYRLHQNVSLNELEQHKEGNGWKPGRFVIEESQGNHVFVRYEDRPKDPGPTWAKVGKNSKVIHYDTEGAFEMRLDSPDRKIVDIGPTIYFEQQLKKEITEEENAKGEEAAQDEKKPAQKMSPILDKVERYFNEYEFGVYKEAQGNKDGAVWKVEPTENTVGYLKAMNAQGKHLFIRPTFENEDRFMMHDDLDQKGLEKHHKQNGKWKPGRMVVESSPGNYQVWIKSDRPLSNNEKKHWLDKMGSDPGASPKHRWGRCPGFRNRKEKYQTEKGYPLSKMVWVDWKNKARVPKIDLDKTAHKVSLIDEKGKQHPIVIMGKAETVEQKAHDYANKIGLEKGSYSVDIQEVDPDKAWEASGYNKSNSPTKTTNYSINQSKPLPTRADYYKGPGKESEQDYSYAMALYRRNVPREVIEQRIRTERTKWENHKGEKRMSSYLKTTLDNAENRVAQTVSHNNSRANNKKRPRRQRRGQGDYKLTVKDIKNGNQKTMIVRGIPDEKAQQQLKMYGKKAISNMGYKNTDNLELRIQRLQNQRRVQVIEKQVAVQA